MHVIGRQGEEKVSLLLIMWDGQTTEEVNN